MVMMLFKTNIFGIIGSDNNPDYKQNQVLIWDDLNKKILDLNFNTLFYCVIRSP